MNKSRDTSNRSQTGPPIRLSPRTLVLLIVMGIGYLLLKPWIEERFQITLPDLVGSPAEQQPGRESAPVTQSPAAEAMGGDSAVAEQVPIETANRSENTTGGALRSRPTTQSRRTDSEPPARSVAQSPSPPATSLPKLNTPSSPSELGKLRDSGNKVYTSTAGLRYKPGSTEGHRLLHVLKHLKDDPSKPSHGVFIGDKESVLKLIDEAYLLAQKRGPPQVHKEVEEERTVYTIDLKQKIGFAGGESGQRRGHPPCSKLRLVLEGDDVITAFPVNQ